MKQLRQVSTTNGEEGAGESLSDFNILQPLGSGAFSQVFKVERQKDGMMYALKKVKLGELSQREKENALNEIRILASVKSPHIIRYKDAFYDEPSKSLCIIMEFAEKGDLLAYIGLFKMKNLQLDEPKVWKYAAEMLIGLKQLHDLKILHRDLKCANIFLGATNQIKLGDLNVSKVTKNDFAYTQIGTPYYSSPEVWKNQPYDSKCDVWSIGCVLYELLARHPPFMAKSIDELYNKITKGTYQRLPKEYSQQINDFIGLCLQNNPLKRPSVNQLLAHKSLQPFLDTEKENKPTTRSLSLLPISEPIELLSTMKMPLKNFKELKNILPKPQFKDSIQSLMENQHILPLKLGSSARIEPLTCPQIKINTRYFKSNSIPLTKLMSSKQPDQSPEPIQNIPATSLQNNHEMKMIYQAKQITVFSNNGLKVIQQQQPKCLNPNIVRKSLY